MSHPRKIIITKPTKKQIIDLLQQEEIQELVKQSDRQTSMDKHQTIPRRLPSVETKNHDLETTDCPVIDSEIELLVDNDQILSMKNLSREIHSPKPREISITFDQPWEGNISAYWTIINDLDRLRMYYRGAEYNPYTRENNGYKVCYAESFDGGIVWNKPKLGLYKYNGSKDNNIIWTDQRGSENFTPFKDTRPGIPENERYKAVGFQMYQYELYGFVSADGINWKLMRQEPLLTFYHGKFDSQNVVFWNPEIKHYMMFFRSYLDKENNIGRGIKVAISRDFIHWKEFKWLEYNDDYSQQFLQLYTNCVQQYYRSPKFIIGFPNRFSEDRSGYPGHPISGIFDAIFMTSRNGYQWTRYQEAMIRPGPQLKKWATRNNIVTWGMVETPSEYENCPNEISVYISEGYFLDKCSLRRHTFRLDGFVSIKAPFSGGELITKPFIFTGNRLRLNFATSALGSIQVEIQDKYGNPIYPYITKNCLRLFGDKVDGIVFWAHAGENINQILVGKPIRLRFLLRDCNLYSYQFL